MRTSSKGMIFKNPQTELCSVLFPKLPGDRNVASEVFRGSYPDTGFPGIWGFFLDWVSERISVYMYMKFCSEGGGGEEQQL